jgi:hypothetical protein
VHALSRARTPACTAAERQSVGAAL